MVGACSDVYFLVANRRHSICRRRGRRDGGMSFSSLSSNSGHDGDGTSSGRPRHFRTDAQTLTCLPPACLVVSNDRWGNAPIIMPGPTLGQCDHDDGTMTEVRTVLPWSRPRRRSRRRKEPLRPRRSSLRRAKSVALPIAAALLFMSSCVRKSCAAEGGGDGDGGDERLTNEDFKVVDDLSGLLRSVGLYRIDLYEIPAGVVLSDRAIDVVRTATETYGYKRLRELYSGDKMQYEVEAVEMVLEYTEAVTGGGDGRRELGDDLKIAARPSEAMRGGQRSRSYSSSSSSEQSERGEENDVRDSKHTSLLSKDDDDDDDDDDNHDDHDHEGSGTVSLDLRDIRTNRKARLRRAQAGTLSGVAIILDGYVRFIDTPVPQDWELRADFRQLMSEFEIGALMEFYPALSDDPELGTVFSAGATMESLRPERPTVNPTTSPTTSPTQPTVTVTPTDQPTLGPVVSPTVGPIVAPTALPTPFSLPKSGPTLAPAVFPTSPKPTLVPSVLSTSVPTVSVTLGPTSKSAALPSSMPTISAGSNDEATWIPMVSGPPSKASPTASPTYQPTSQGIIARDPNSAIRADTTSLNATDSGNLTIILATSLVGLAVASVLSLLFFKRRVHLRLGKKKNSVKGDRDYYADLEGGGGRVESPAQSRATTLSAGGSIRSGLIESSAAIACVCGRDAEVNTTEHNAQSTSMDSGITPRICGSNPDPYGPSPMAETPASGYGTGRDGLQFDPRTGGTRIASGLPSSLHDIPSLSESSSSSSPTSDLAESVSSKRHEQIEVGTDGVEVKSADVSFSSSSSESEPLAWTGSGGTPSSSSEAECANSEDGFGEGSLGATPQRSKVDDHIFGTSLMTGLLFGTGGRQSGASDARNDGIVGATPTTHGGKMKSAAEMNSVGSRSLDRTGEKLPIAWSARKARSESEETESNGGVGAKTAIISGIKAHKFNFDDVSAENTSADSEGSKNSQTETPMTKNSRLGNLRRRNGVCQQESAEFHAEEWGRDLKFDWDPVRDNPDGKVREGGVVCAPNQRNGRNRAETCDSSRSRGTEGSLTSRSHGASTRLDDDEAPLDGEMLSPGDGAFPSPAEYKPEANDDFKSARSRCTDGESTYKTCRGTVLHPLDWSNKGSDTELDDASAGMSTISDTASGDKPRRSGRRNKCEKRIIWSAQLSPPGRDRGDGGSGGSGAVRRRYDKRGNDVYDSGVSPRDIPLPSPDTGNTELPSPYSAGNNTQASGSVASVASGTTTSSRQLINDLVWLEKKIADSKSQSESAGDSLHANVKGDKASRNIADCSLSLGSDLLSPSSGSADDSTAGSSCGVGGLLQSIVCRDCYAPPGKLKIVITSTKDGPSVHTVKHGSSLEGHLFAGDLIVAVEDVDTRTFSAEQVMKMLTSKADFERKITVLHFVNR